MAEVGGLVEGQVQKGQALHIVGQLPDFGIQDLLQVLLMHRRHGWIRVVEGKLELRLRIAEGLVVEASCPQLLMFGEFLIQRHVLKAESLSNVLALQHHHKKPLGAMLLDAGLLSEEDLRTLLAQFFVELALRGMRWKSGRVEFRELAVAEQAQGMGEHGCRIDFLVLEATHRLDQWQRLASQEGRMISVLKIHRDFVAEGKSVKLGRRTWRILSMVNGRRDIGRILEKLGGDPAEHMAAIDAMVKAGLLLESQFSQLDLIVPGRIPMERRSPQAWFPGQFEANILFREIDGRRNLLELSRVCRLPLRRIWDYFLLLMKGGTVEIISGIREYHNLLEEQ